MKQRHALFVRLHIFKTPTCHKVHHASKHFWTVNDNVRLNKRNIFGLFCLLDLLTSCPAQEKVQNLRFNCVFVNDICQRPWRCPRVACDFTIIVLLMARAVSFKSPSRIRLNIHCVTVTPHFLPVLITLRRCGELFEKVRASEIKSGEHTRGKVSGECVVTGKENTVNMKCFLQHVVEGVQSFPNPLSFIKT